MLKCKANGDSNLFVINKNSPNEDERLLSEIWGYSERTRLTKDVNNQLKQAGMFLQPMKVLTSHSYRRGVAIIATRGIMEAKYLLGHVRVNSTEAYLERYADLDRLVRTLSAVHKIKKSSEAVYKSYILYVK